MELWIRSQDKRILKRLDGASIPFNKFSTYKNAKDIDKEVLKCCIVDETNLELGIYSTEKQAFEVLDEIQNKLVQVMTINNPQELPYLRKDSIVYQMPEDKGENYDTI